MAGVPHRLAIAWVLLLAAAAAHAERKVYKCTGADGVVVFSEQACGRDAQELNVDTGRAEPPPAAVAAQPTDTSTPPRPPKKRGAPDSLRDISDGVDDANCRRDAERLAVIGDDGRLDDLVRRKENVASEINSNTSALGPAWGQRQISPSWKWPSSRSGPGSPCERCRPRPCHARHSPNAMRPRRHEKRTARNEWRLLGAVAAVPRLTGKDQRAPTVPIAQAGSGRLRRWQESP
jgi:hypothetical protein